MFKSFVVLSFSPDTDWERVDLELCNLAHNIGNQI